MAGRHPGIENIGDLPYLAGMLTNHQSEPNCWDSVPGKPCGQPYGLPYFHGEKISVSFGRLEPGMWDEYSSRRVRIVFTFDHVFGLIEPRWDGTYCGPSWYMKPHQFCIIPPGLETNLDWVQRAELVILYVEPTAFGECELLPWNLISGDFRVFARRDPYLAHLAQIFFILCRQSDLPEPDFVGGIGMALASRTIAQYFSPDESRTKVRSGLPLDTVTQVTTYIDAHLSDAILASDLARRVGLSPDHFARRFKITAKMSPKQFMLRRRMEKVRELLGTGKYNVTQAGREVGFHDPSHLNRCFRNVFGRSPMAVLKGALQAPGDN